MVAVGDSIWSKIGKTKKENACQATDGEKDCRAADQPIGVQTLVRVARPPAEIIKIDLPMGGAMRKRGRPLGQWSCHSYTM
jgi:hypothetical protein